MNPKLPQLRARDIDRILRHAGFDLSRQRGSHAHYKSRKTPTRWVTVPMHTRPLKKGTLRNIIRQTGLSVSEFLDLR